MKVRATWLLSSLILVLALTSQGVPVAQQAGAGQPGAAQGGAAQGGAGRAGDGQAGDGQPGAGRGGRGGTGRGGAQATAAQLNYVPPVRSPINKTITTTRPVTDAMLRNPDPGDWLMFRRTYDAQSYSPLDKVNTSNVKNLQLVWSWGIEKGASPSVDDWIGPIVHDGVMYLSMPGGRSGRSKIGK